MLDHAESAIIEAGRTYHVYGRDYSTQADFTSKITFVQINNTSLNPSHPWPIEVTFENGVTIRGEITGHGTPGESGHAWYLKEVTSEVARSEA